MGPTVWAVSRQDPFNCGCCWMHNLPAETDIKSHYGAGLHGENAAVQWHVDYLGRLPTLAGPTLIPDGGFSLPAVPLPGQWSKDLENV